MASKWHQKGGGKGAARGQNQPQNAQVLEMQFQQCATQLFDQLMDWDHTNPGLLKGFGVVLTLRTELMKAYHAQAGFIDQFAPVALAGKNTAASPDGVNVNWKGELFTEYARLTKKPVTKEDISIEVADVEGGGFLATLNCEAQGWQFQGEAVASKKLAEQSAAKAALQEAFPAVYARLAGMSGRPGQSKADNKRKAPRLDARTEKLARNMLVNSNGQGNMVEQILAAMQGSKGGEGGGDTCTTAKSRIAQASQLLTGQCAKGDVIYECVPVENDPEGKIVATVTLQAHDSSVGYQGLPAANKKLAEANAAEAALEALAEQLVPLEEEHKAKKAKKNKEGLEALRERTAAKKSGKEAALGVVAEE